MKIAVRDRARRVLLRVEDEPGVDAVGTIALGVLVPLALAGLVFWLALSPLFLLGWLARWLLRRLAP